MPRKSKLTQERQARIIEALELGMKIKDVCAVADITTETYFAWLKRGESGEGKIYSDFSDAVKRAVPVAKTARINTILEAARGGQEITEKRITSRKVGEDKVEIIEQVAIVKQAPPQWQAMAWLLERQYPSEFGRREQVESFNIDLSSLNDDQLQRIASGESIRSVLAIAGESGVGAPSAHE